MRELESVARLDDMLAEGKANPEWISLVDGTALEAKSAAIKARFASRPDLFRKPNITKRNGYRSTIPGQIKTLQSRLNMLKQKLQLCEMLEPYDTAMEQIHEETNKHFMIPDDAAHPRKRRSISQDQEEALMQQLAHLDVEN